MSDQTSNLHLPFIVPDQAQKHVTHNEALQRLDALTQLVIHAILTQPPASPADGSCFAIGAGASGLWSGRDGKIGIFQDGAWDYVQPQAGWMGWLASTGKAVRYDGSAWVPVASPLPADLQVQTLGVNASADSNNRLTVSAPASLFNHEGGSHQVKINRGSDSGVGSVLFQTGYSGRAEFGLIGDANFSLKLSGNGSAWKTGLSVDMMGVVRLPNNPACRASLNPAVLSPAAGSQTGFQTLSINQGGFSLGSAIPQGTGSRLLVPASGLYLISLSAIALSSQGHSIAVLLNGSSTLATLKGNANTTNTTASTVTLSQLSAGDTLSCQHSGTAQLDFGPGKTELIVTLL